MPKVKSSRPDRENPEWTATDFKKATRLSGTSLTEAVSTLRRGRGPQVKPKKVAISIRVNPKIIAHFKAGGAGWQARMEKVLLKASAIKD